MRYLSFALIFVAVILNSTPSQGHGDAQWIQDGGYGCCGPTDCERAPASRWSRVENGFRNNQTGEFIHEGNIAGYSVDDQYWDCGYNSYEVDAKNPQRAIRVGNGAKKCLFPPALGF